MSMLRDARQAAGLTQAEVARRARVPQPTVARLEARGANPRIETLDRLLRACDRRLDAVPLSPSSVDETLVAERLRRAPGERVLDFEASHAELEALRGMAAISKFRPSELLRTLTAHGVDFVVIGGIAMVAQGSSRNTFDLDVTYATDGANLDALGAALLELGARRRGADEDVPFVPDGATLRRTWILTLATSAGSLAVFATPPGAPSYEELRRRAVRVLVGDVAVLVASLEDLEAMKRTAGRTKDLIDLEEIEVIRRLS